MEIFNIELWQVKLQLFLYVHPCLWQLVVEYNHRLTEADAVEENIIQAQVRAKAEEERALNVLKGDAGKDFHKMGLPPGEDSGNTISPHYVPVVPGH